MRKFNLAVSSYLSTILLIGLSLFSCQSEKNQNSDSATAEKRIGLLLVNHGSRSATWRQSLLDLENNVKDSILATGKIQGTKTAFMEYTEPSIATQLKAFDSEGYTDVIIVPVFLTVSSHSFDDIPTIIGSKEDPNSLETLKVEKIERYTPEAKIQITPLLDFSGVLKKNILRRVNSISNQPKQEGLVMIAYGDATYNKEWSELLEAVGSYVQQNTGIDSFSYGWCGHIAHYNPDSTTVAINRVLLKKEKALVVPVLVAHDEMFQVKIIGDGISKISDNTSRVSYRPDSILPDENVEKWIKEISLSYANKILNRELATNQ